MTAFCEALVALGLTLASGWPCRTEVVRPPPLPADDQKVWAVSAPPPEKPPAFPPVVIRQEGPPPAPPPPPPAPRARPAPQAPNPYQLALSGALAGQGRGGIGGFEGERLASPVPPGMTTASLPGPLDLGPPTRAKKYSADGVKSSLPVDNERIVAADRYISGIMETGLNSQLDSGQGGTAIIQTSRDVYGYHGRNVLIPKGSRLICGYESPGKQGFSRIAFTCDRILMGGHRAEILQLASPLGDVQGRAGVAGEVDNRFWEKYGTAFILAGLSASIRLATATTAGTNTTNSLGTASERGSQELSQKIGEITASILEQTVNLAPIITIAQGTRVQIRPAKDWYIRRIGEEDPKEESHDKNRK